MLHAACTNGLRESTGRRVAAGREWKMTFSIAARCSRTGQMGAAVATSTIAVGARVAFATANVGAVVVQYWADQRLALRGLELMKSGCTAEEALSAMIASTPHRERRQVALIDASGNTATFNGSYVRPHFTTIRGRNCVAAGNILANEAVIAAMVRAFERSESESLAERLLRAIEAGVEAGGEPVPLQSSALLVVDKLEFPYIDLRVDLSKDPHVALRRLWTEYSPRADEYMLRVTDPDKLG